MATTEGTKGTRPEVGRPVYCLKTQASDRGNSGNEDGEKWVVLREIKKIKTQRFWRLSVSARESRMTPDF